MLSCTGKRSHRHTILHVSFSNSFGLASARPTPQGLSGAPKFQIISSYFQKMSFDFTFALSDIVFVNSFISTVYGLKGRKMMARIL